MLMTHTRQCSGTLFRNKVASFPRQAYRRTLVLHASQFHHILKAPDLTAAPYDGHTLSQLAPSQRAVVLRRVARDVSTDVHPYSEIQDTEPGICVNGARRNHGQAEFDWMMDGRRVKCKSSQLSWCKKYRRWFFDFVGIKLPYDGFRQTASFDDLFLVLYSPADIRIIKHNLSHGVTSSGARTGPVGHSIRMAGKKHQDWQGALACILHKFQSGSSPCEHVAKVSIHDGRVKSALATFLGKQAVAMGLDAYLGTPLATMNASLRGLRLQAMAFEIDQLVNPMSTFQLPDGNDLTISGSRRGSHSAKIDWLRDGRRVEMKHSKMHWNDDRQFWRCQFSNIKFAHPGSRPRAHFDELWLAIYSPFGLHMFRHNGLIGVSSAGIRAEVGGGSVFVLSRKGIKDARQACDILIEKCLADGCERIATVSW
eukprot:TRINITY_DN88615_c0_g1_i1.p1 TRINITY_DN88615_c0_g1~~TRINITY_DN88615_c0_g1_i1.p1  ORF type:complete len:425 (+),score=35.79 TRINITY_DN88615_c0_g1_i1:74-1348(+)